MRVVIVGAGGVGGYLGGLLAREGHDVALVARGAHLRAIREHGLAVRSVHGDFVVRRALATDAPSELGRCDLLVFSVKTYDTDAAAEASKGLVGKETTVLPLQNGVDASARLASHFGAERVISGVAWIVASIAEPGVILQESAVRRFVIGETSGEITYRLSAIRDVIASSGCTVDATTEIGRVLWMKLLFIASIAGLTSVTRSSVGRILAVPETAAMLKRAMAEVDAVARAKGIPLEDGAVDKGMGFAAMLEPTATSSMARDVAAGRRSEYEALSGAVVRAGKDARVPTPVHEFCWTLLKTMEPV